MKNNVGFFGECEFNDCDCQLFVNQSTGNGETYPKRIQNQPKQHKIKISSLALDGKAKLEYSTCKKCGKQIRTISMVSHQQRHRT